MYQHTASHKKAIRVMVRDELAKDPMVTMRQLAERVSGKMKHPVSRQYIAQLVRKVDGELSQESKQTHEVLTRVQRSSELFRVLKNKLLAIAFWSPDVAKDDPSLTFMPFYKDQVAALKTLAMIEKLGFDMELDAGVYRRHLGSVELERRNAPMPAEYLALVGDAMKNWGFKPPLRVQATVVEETHVIPAPSPQPAVSE